MVFFLCAHCYRANRLLKSFFQDCFRGQAIRPAWVPPIPGRQRVALQEARTLQTLEAMKQRLMDLQDLPERHRYQELLASFDRQRQGLNQHHRQRKHWRNQQRQRLGQTLQGEALEAALEALAQQKSGRQSRTAPSLSRQGLNSWTR